ncbi:Scarecrow-like transcription factor pat1 [Thalictrum thalictroides]|uniref:Scarecrow-like transcription factor pat1 n=1 Tax=Thalictrum thalictroides TaxID=46969 RepID=A0A7J6UWH2_THATH|nr:Scarecrow-like transcription factor pat1 [Thalictrum thalictroides]
MANAFFSFEPFNSSGYQNGYGSLLQGDLMKGVNKEIQTRMFHETPEERVMFSKYHGDSTFTDFGMSEETVYSPMEICPDSPNFDTILQEISVVTDFNKEKPEQISLASLKLLSDYRNNGLNKSNEEKEIEQSNGRRLSTEEVIRVAGARYIQLYVQTDDDLSMLGHPFGCALSGLSTEEIKDVELAHFLLAAAEKVGNKQFERANKLLSQCDYLASITGNPVQRVVYYFAEALQERIDRETGRSASGKQTQELDFEQAMMSLNPAVMGYYERLPFSQMLQVTVSQTIIDHVGLAKKIHLIDLGIRTGMQWIVLMHALASRGECRPVELFTITAIGTTASKQKIKDTGMRLSGFAKSINMPFSFKTVTVAHMKELKEDLFEIEAEEAVAVFSPMVLKTMIGQPDLLENLMQVIKSINPCIMVVTEIEANHNSPIFVNRFIETLFFYSAFFDSFEACTDRNDHNRMMAEKVFNYQTIRNIVATEGKERIMRHVGINVWKTFFSQFDMVETQLSESSLYQARLVIEKFVCGGSCTVDMEGKCLTVGWKGTPFHSLSAWKFNNLESATSLIDSNLESATSLIESSEMLISSI